MGFSNVDRTGKFKTYGLLKNNKSDFQKNYQALLTPVASKYAEKLNGQITKWKTDDLYKNITLNNPEKVVFYGNYMLNNWVYQDLTLTSIYIPMVVKINTSVSEELTSISTTMANLMASDGTLIDRIKNTSAGEDIEMKMNKTDFEKLKNDDSTIGDGFDYISKKNYC